MDEIPARTVREHDPGAGRRRVCSRLSQFGAGRGELREGQQPACPARAAIAGAQTARAWHRVAATKPIRLTHGHAVAIQRFDRHRGLRLHSLSAAVTLRAAGERFGYPELAQLLRRRGVTTRDRHIAQMRELFRRMVFNILMDNTDDHEKNHALIVTDANQFELSPAYDVLPTGRALGFQQMRVGEQEADSTLQNALSMAQLFALEPDAAQRELRAVAKVVDGWKEHFRQCGVTASDVKLLAEQVDRTFLLEQRKDVRRRT